MLLLPCLSQLLCRLEALARGRLLCRLEAPAQGGRLCGCKMCILLPSLGWLLCRLEAPARGAVGGGGGSAVPGLVAVPLGLCL